MVLANPTHQTSISTGGRELITLYNFCTYGETKHFHLVT